jgi:anti-sigma-K factor RskA
LRHDRLTEEGQELAALYALGSLTQHEARAFESHLHEGCDVCRAETRHFENVVGALGSGVTEVNPPAYLRSLLEARIEREARLKKSEAPEVAPVIPFPEKTRSTRSGISGSTFGRVLIPWAVAASLLIALAYSIASWQSERKALQAALAQNQNEIAQLRDRFNSESARANEIAQINSVLASPQNPRIAMAGQEVAPSSSANIYWDVQGKRWVVTADLSPAPAGKVYQLWFVTPDGKVSAGLIEPDGNGHGFAVINIPPNVTNVEAAAITLEPKGGSEQPTMPIYALGKIG